MKDQEYLFKLQMKKIETQRGYVTEPGSELKMFDSQPDHIDSLITSVDPK